MSPTTEGFATSHDELEITGILPATTDETASGFKARLASMGTATKEKAIEWKQGLELGIVENPIRSVLIAAGIGCAIGVLGGVLASRRSR